jgi:hypothetical protein
METRQPQDHGPLLDSRAEGGGDAGARSSFRERARKAGFSDGEVDVLIAIYGKAGGQDRHEHR